MGCVSQTAFQEHCSGNTDKMSENQSQDAYHSAEDIQAAESKDEMQPVYPKIKFPPASDTKAWCMLDYTVSKTLHKELGNKKYNQQLNKSSQVIYKVCKRIYGMKEKKKATSQKQQTSKNDTGSQNEEKKSKKANPFHQRG